ncbi:transposase [Klebsiella quasipneumoniae]|uniref:transposase n=1 Tax=Klebsiella quasipneumoniae TaxID=1463165 RepID=UPI00111E3213|nr:transposase [Klebsiella quasipneumoniae]TNJ95413.1 transposase [Klebsiella quasipneumoniae subsp. similipneumoniae]
MSITMDEEIKRWTAKRKSALVMEIIQGKTTVAEAARAFDLPPSEIEEWVDDAKRGMENALRAKLLWIFASSEKQLKEPVKLMARPCWVTRQKKLASLLGEDDDSRRCSAGITRRRY